MAEDQQLEWRADFHSALSNPNRLEIIDLLGDEEVCQCEIFPEIGLAQSTVSSYLAQMVRAGILHVRRDGTRKLYRIRDPRIGEIVKRIRALAEDLSH
ncbi:transcriptional regulator [Candidatus Thorarchaeota archaeon]|nr:MAG: transcriptional regulator [Candidatus Thorarchaeota archaeon]